MKKSYRIFIFLFFCSSLFYAQCPTFTISAPGGYTIACNPSSLNYYAINTSTLSNVTYTWTAPSLSTSVGPILTINAPGTYTIMASAPTSTCNTSQTLAIGQNTITPTISVTPTTASIICSAPVTFTAYSSSTTNIAGQWYDSLGNALSAVGSTPMLLAVINPGAVVATFTNMVSGCVASQTVNAILTSSLPVVSVSPNSGSVSCGGSPVSFTASASGNATGVWYNNLTPMTSPGSSITFTTLNSGTYSAVFTDTITGCSSASTVAVTSPTVMPTMTISATTFALPCTTGTITLGAWANVVAMPTAYWFTTPSGTVSSLTGGFTLNLPGNYNATIIDGNLCKVSQPFYISNTTGTISILSTGAASVCLGTSASLSAAGATNYTWSTGVTTSTLNVLPTSTTVYSVTGHNGLCFGYSTTTVTVDNTCSDVWPGDANSDGIANNLDILELGLHSGSTGPARTFTGTSWIPHFANNWSGNISTGKNKCHADCNGDGVIDGFDKGAVAFNFNQTHTFKPIETLAPDMYIVPDQSNVSSGTWGSASIYLGDLTNVQNNIYGVAFEVIYDNTLIQTDSVYIVYIPSFLNSANSNIEFEKNIFANGSNYAASVRTDQTNVSGVGKIASVFYKTKSGLSNDAILNIGVANITRINSAGVSSSLAGGTNTLTINSSIGIRELNAPQVSYSIYPNPANSNLTILVKEEHKSITLTIKNSVGKTLVENQIQVRNQKCSLSVSELPTGVYFITLSDDDFPVTKKLVITR
jgi:hypothetical protein